MSAAATEGAAEGVRLQKVMAQAGVGSRRYCEDLIASGRVAVNDQVVRRLGTRVDPADDIVRVDGRRVPSAPGLVCLALNKPSGVVSTMSDPRGRPSLARYVGDRSDRLFHVGRLDADTEGLLLLTNDGELAHRLAHPRYETPKTYVAEVPGPVPYAVGRRLRAGVDLADGTARVDGFRLLDTVGGRAMVEVVLHEGRKRVVRRLLAEVGHPVRRLVRTRLGPVRLGDQRPGTTRRLSLDEIAELYTAVGL